MIEKQSPTTKNIKKICINLSDKGLWFVLKVEAGSFPSSDGTTNLVCILTSMFRQNQILGIEASARWNPVILLKANQTLNQQFYNDNGRASFSLAKGVFDIGSFSIIV
ncbi:hypothetical protein WN943_021867 [Citrus x changshan-huyou]